MLLHFQQIDFKHTHTDIWSVCVCGMGVRGGGVLRQTSDGTTTPGRDKSRVYDKVCSRHVQLT